MPNLKQQVDITANGSQYESYLKQLPGKTRDAIKKAGTHGGGGFGEGGFLGGALEGAGLAKIAAGGGAALAGAKAVEVTFKVVEAFGELIKATLEYADHIRDLSDQTNIADEDIQALGIAARQNGRNEEDMVKTVEAFKSARVEALGGDEGKLKGFQKTGISEEELRNATSMEQLINKMETSSDVGKSGLSDIIGKKNIGTFNATKDVLGDFTNFKKELIESGRILSREDIDAVEEFKDALAEFAGVLRATVLPIITPTLRLLSEAITEFANAVSKSKGFIKGAIKTGVNLAGELPVIGPGIKALNLANELTGATDKAANGETLFSPTLAERRAKFKANREKNPKDTALQLDNGANIVNEKRQKDADEKAKKQAEKFLQTQNELLGVLNTPHTDSLLSVGNFLGQNGSQDLNAIGQQQLEVAREMAGYLRRIAERAEARVNLGVIG